MKKIFIVLLVLLVVIAYVIAKPASIVIAKNIVSGIQNNIVRNTAIVDSQHWVYSSSGQGEPVILLHGFGASKESWGEIIPFLAHSYHVIAVDIPGYGESSKDVNASYSINAQVLRLDAFVENLGLESFYLAGNSMGGAIAGTYAAKFPEKIKSLWLIAPAGVRSADKSDFDRFHEETGENVMVAGTVAEFDRQMSWLYHTPPEIPVFIKRGIVDLISVDSGVVKKLHTDLIRGWVPLEEVLQGFVGPVLITWGKNDRLTHVSGATVLHKVLPQAKTHLMAETGHVPMMEHPAKVAEQFILFDKSLARAQ